MSLPQTVPDDQDAFNGFDVAPAIAPELEGHDDQTPLYKQHGVNGTDLEAMTFPPVQWVVPGLIPEGYGLIVAPPKAGKSWMVAGIGLAAAQGGTAFGSVPVHARPVLYLALEDGLRRLQDRYTHLLDGAPIPRRMVSVTDVSPAVAWSTMREFALDHREENPLIIVDTYQKIAPLKTPGEGAYEHDYRAGGMFKDLARLIPGGTVLAVHHTNKGVHDDFQDSVSGTQGVAGAADFAMVLNRPRKSDDAILSITGRDVFEDEYAMSTSDGVWSLFGDSLATARDRVEGLRESAQQAEAMSRKGSNQQRIAEFVDRANTIVTVDDVAAQFPDMQKDTVRKNLNRAASGGLIKSPSRGLYAPLSYVSEVS